MSKRELAAKVLGNAIARQVWAWTGGRPAGLRILAYHRVLDDDPAAFPFDEELISASTDAFRRQMQFVRRNFDVISFRDLAACESEGRRWPRRALIVTFDDGFRDNYTNAFPVLKELGLPATIFLATGHVGCAKLLWSDAIAYCFKHTQLRSVTLPEVSRETMSIESAKERRAAIGRILRWIKQTPEETKRDFLDHLSAKLNVSIPDSIAEGMHLTWEDVRSMAANRIEFGSHTVTHPILANVSPAQLEEEVRESKRAIEQSLGDEVIALAYPVGGRSAFNLRVQEVVAKCGYKYAVSYEQAIWVESECGRLAMPRIHVEREYALDLFRANLMFPQVMLRSRRARPEPDERVALQPPVPAAK